jgi:transcriptional regulator with XRE-family HTH domain
MSIFDDSLTPEEGRPSDLWASILQELQHSMAERYLLLLQGAGVAAWGSATTRLTFGAVLQRIRQARGLSQHQLAACLPQAHGRPKMRVAFLQDLEQDGWLPLPLLLQDLAVVLDIPVRPLLTHGWIELVIAEYRTHAPALLVRVVGWLQIPEWGPEEWAALYWRAQRPVDRPQGLRG